MSRPTADFIGVRHAHTGRIRWVPGALLIACMLSCSAAAAQDRDEPSPVAEVTKQVLTDITTYLPASLRYLSMQLDWNSSQPLFRQGFVEDNPGYTRSGLPHDVPISYADGNRQLIGRSLAMVPLSLANNAVNRVIQRSLADRFPKQRKLWTAVSWVERAAFASYASYRVSGPHVEQWKKNRRMAAQLGNY